MCRTTPLVESRSQRAGRISTLIAGAYSPVRTLKIHFRRCANGSIGWLQPGSAKSSDSREAEMAYERVDEALRQLRTDRAREEATEKQLKRADEEARMRFAQIKSAVIGP